jgi:ABC-type sulfate transport system permease subunit
MIETTFLALLMMTVRVTALLATANTPTSLPAILLTPVATATNVENRAAVGITANSLTKNQFRGRCHLLVLDTGQRPRIVGA